MIPPQIATGVPASELQDVIDGYHRQKPPPVSVTSSPDGPGTFTVIAVFPADAANAPNQPGPSPSDGQKPHVEDPSHHGSSNSKEGQMYTDQFRQLVASYIESHSEFPNLVPITVAQWTLESGYGQSDLATRHHNYAGLKFRGDLGGIATPVSYNAIDGADTYSSFKSNVDFITGYWRFINRPPYAGWRNHTSSGTDFINFIGPIYTPTQLYAEKVIELVPTAEQLIAEVSGPPLNPSLKPVGTSETPTKPNVTFIESPNHSSRNGERIKRIILHCTTTRDLNSTISWFKNPSSKVSAHYVVARDGTIIQMVRDGDKAWHALAANTDSIGIEHSASPTDGLTDAQTTASVHLIKWLMTEYKVSKTSITGHRFAPEDIGHTDCPDHIFGDATEQALNQWLDNHF